MDPADAQLYESLIPLVQQHAAGAFIYAAPDCPEVYFLSGLADPVGSVFEFFDDRTKRVLDTIEQHSVNVVVLNKYPNFSGPIPLELGAALTNKFPHSTTIGRFDVRWKQ